MTRRKEPAGSVEGKAELTSEDLMTAEDLFGDLVDGTAPPRPAAPAKARKAGPLRVRINDPARSKGELPPDVEALLARLEPMEGKAPTGPVPAPPPDETPPPGRSPQGLEDAGSDPGVSDLLDHDELVARRLAPEDEAEDAPKELGDEPLPVAAPRTSTKFQVSPVSAIAQLDDGLDLAAVAREAITPETAEDSRPEKGTWRDDVYGPYQLLDRIAVGGMAEVFKAKRTGLAGFEKTLAVKRILPHLSDNEEFVRMFVDEAKMVAGMTHPNIVQIFDLGKIDKSYFIAMEYVHGRDLRTIMKRAKEKELRLPLDLALRVAAALGAALEFAHRKKDERGRAMEIVHRDVSPQNILISFEGDVKLTDFGIAKAATKASNTDRGALRGKLLYMSPEQAWGKTIDRRSDIFSLGIVLYEMITEEKPFLLGNDGSEMTILEKVRRCEVAPARSLNPKIPESLDRVVMKALARDADERYQDAAEMNRALERVVRERQPLSTGELKRFMELLFDRDEREEAIPEDLIPGTPARPIRVIAESGLDEGEGPIPEKTPAPDTRPDAELSVDALLRRFGIK